MANTMFPGRPDYSGPTNGMFGLLHHEVLCEPSDNVMERVEYVRMKKPPHEIAVRLHNMIYLGGCLEAAQHKTLYDAYVAQHKTLYDAYDAQRKPLDDAYDAQRKPLDDAYDAQYKTLYDAYDAQYKTLYDAYVAQRKPLDDAILAYIRTHIPDCAWNGMALVFPREGA